MLSVAEEVSRRVILCLIAGCFCARAAALKMLPLLHYFSRWLTPVSANSACASHSCTDFNSKTSLYIREEGNQLRHCIFNEETQQYCFNYKGTPVPNQPDPQRDIVVLKRTYRKKRDGTLARDIVEIVEMGGTGADKEGYYVVMYVGESYSNPLPHGNSRQTQQPHSGFIASRDSRLLMPNVPRISRKPHQDKSARAERVRLSRSRAGSRSRSKGRQRDKSI